MGKNDTRHGGEDPGTIANGITEKEYTLKISQYINKRLKELGVDSSLTRDSDITLNPSERPKKVQSFYGDGSDVVVVSNHINAGGPEVELLIKKIIINYLSGNIFNKMM